MQNSYRKIKSMRATTTTIFAFQQKILDHYAAHGRTLPWRQTTDPYSILISEVMLQQTQVERVIAYYTTWLERWPTVNDLASAQRTDVLAQWMGLGYNNRAINLHRAAQKIVSDYDGEVIAACKDHKHVPGIGPYTSAAVRIFATNEDITTVDTNIRRILIHEFRLLPTVSDKELWALAAQCLPRGRSRDWHNALMDYGATLMTSRRTGIKPKTTQSTFQGSDRQIRAKIVRHLLAEKHAALDALLPLADGDEARLERIIEKLVKDGVVQNEGTEYTLHNG